jgi:DNA-binding GntR family transcriptional regulator
MPARAWRVTLGAGDPHQPIVPRINCAVHGRGISRKITRRGFSIGESRMPIIDNPALDIHNRLSIIDYRRDQVKLKPTDIARESLADRVRQVLTARIFDGVYPPGTRLIEIQVAREFNISQAPVREALSALEAAHLVETAPYRGTRVRRIGDDECREAYQVRAVLEELAARLGAARLRERLRELRNEADAALAAARQDDVVRYLQHNVRFHRMIVEAAENTVLLRTWESLGFTVGARARAARTSGDMIAVAKEHRQIVEALARGDGKSASRLLRRHVEVLVEGAGKSEPHRSNRARRPREASPEEDAITRTAGR